MNISEGAKPRPAFNGRISDSNGSLRAQAHPNSSLVAGSPPIAGQLERTNPPMAPSSERQERVAIAERETDHQDSVLESIRKSSVQYEKTHDRRTLAGIVYGPPIGAPPGHYKRPAPTEPPMPTIVRMGGSSFRKDSTNSVIAVLLEEPRVSIGGRQRKSNVVHNSLERQAQPRESRIIRQNPKRVRIRSQKLLKSLEQIAESVGHSFLTSGIAFIVFLQPFKLFVTLEPQIRERLRQLELGDQECRNHGTQTRDEKIRVDRPARSDPTIVDLSDDAKVPGGSTIGEAPRPNLGGDRKSVTPALEGEDKETLEHLRLLVELFDTDLKPVFDMRREIKERTLLRITYSDLWHLFEFGQDVKTADSDSQVYRVLRLTGGREILAKHGLSPELRSRGAIDTESLQKSENRSETFILECVSFEFDGQHFGPVQKTFVIRKYDGEKAITSLPIYPLAFDPDQNNIRERLIARGNRYLQFSQVDQAAHMHYSGLTLDEPHELVDSQIIVDTRMAMLRYYTNLPPVRVGNLIGHNLREIYEETINPTVNEGVCSEDGCCDNDWVHKDYNWELQYEDEFFDGHKAVLTPTEDPNDLEDEEKLLLPPYVYGFVLRSRKWAMFDIDLIRDVAHTSGFEDLVLPAGHKETVRALVANHAREPSHKGRKPHGPQTIDLVRGKGKGLVILLHGAPGVGKTSTAECVADSTKRPLFPITCGDIGDTASEVEANLESNFQLAHKWGCVLLLDEADIFLQKRDKADIKRNSIVSVFLRTLEYYNGILFLTTNRVGLFDPAFRSRIHISLYYPGLQKEATMQIWKMHIARTQEMKGDKFKIKTKEILKFAKEHYMELKKAKSGSWNGRQIRNAFQTAMALAEFEAAEEHEKHSHSRKHHVELNREHFTTVAQASKQFDKYLRSTLGGQTEADVARLEQTRVDDFHSLMERMEQSEEAQRAKLKGRKKAKVETDSEESEELDSEESSEDDDTESKSSDSESEEEQRVSIKSGKKSKKGRK